MVKLEYLIVKFGHEMPRCQAIARSGKQCGQPAVQGKQHCWNKEHHNFADKDFAFKKRVRKPKKKAAATVKKAAVKPIPVKKISQKTEPIKKIVVSKKPRQQNYAAIFTPEIKTEILKVWDKIILDFWKGMQGKHPINA